MNLENKNELKKQDRTIRKSLAFVFIPILIFLIIVVVIQNNSESYLEKEYLKIRNESYSGKVTNLLLNRMKGRMRPILIDNKFEKEVPYFIHEKLNVGDSLFKKGESDFEYYILNSKKDTIERDLNKFHREKYFDKLNEK
ncbi:hypothetical protein BXQ17_07880 [Polaribacter sp. BM10]|uniref:hypothetical protein n=1 Tax=Polaribacter sp. BM10 TaxID=1529069 RepID=UPI000989ABEE|nr:hypothetical protein [Polaribacter sp. BM10]AQS93984.1 hypothetical protein BXQ17_07880 [Polaribacter sp. BM10]